MDELFEGIYSAGEYNTKSKVQLVEMLLKIHQIDTAWMVGDRSSDVEAGIQNNLTTIGCNYASFGESIELNQADLIISQFNELYDLIV